MASVETREVEENIQITDMLRRENDELKLEIVELKRELDELQDSFRTKDAEEFQRIQMELEMANKKCRVMQYRLLRMEKRNGELTEEKMKLEDSLSFAKDNESRVEELKDELAIAKEVSVRLHKELEETEESRAVLEKLNNQLRSQFNAFKEGHLDPDRQNSKLSDELYNALSREYQLTEKVSELERQIKSLQIECQEGFQSRQNQIDHDQKLIMLHSYVCRLRDTIDQKDQLIESLQNKYERTDNSVPANQENHTNHQHVSVSTPDLSILEEMTGDQMWGRPQRWQDASTQCKETQRCTKSVNCHLSEQAEERNIEPQEIEELRSALQQYINIKDELHNSLREASELMMGKDQEIEMLRSEKERLDAELVQFQRNLEKKIKAASQKHVELIEGLRRENEQLRQGFDSLSDELKCSRQEQFKSEQERVRQLQELRGLEQNYRELGERLDEEVRQLNKQINLLNEDKERLETNLQRLKGQKLRQQPVSRLIVNNVGKSKVTNDRKRKTITNGTSQQSEQKATDPPEIRVKLQQHNSSPRNYESRSVEQSTRSTRVKQIRPFNGTQRVPGNVEEAKKVNKVKPSPRPQQDLSRPIRKIPLIKRNDPHSETDNTNESKTPSSIATKAQSLISRIRYRSSSRSTRSTMERSRHESKLPKPALSNGLEKQKSSDVVQSSFIGESQPDKTASCLPSTVQQSFSENQMDTLMSRVTSTARPLMMSSLEEDA